MIPGQQGFARGESRVDRRGKKAIERTLSPRYDYGLHSGSIAPFIVYSSTICKAVNVDDPLDNGIKFFNAGQYFEAHEAWEELWRQTGGPLRLYYQGLVQTAVGLHHLAKGNLNGARAQLGKALQKLKQYPETFCRIDNLNLIAEIQSALHDVTPRSILILRK